MYQQEEGREQNKCSDTSVGCVTTLLLKEIMTGRPANRPTNRPTIKETNMKVHREVKLPISGEKDQNSSDL